MIHCGAYNREKRYLCRCQHKGGGWRKIKALWTKKMTSDIKWNLHKQVRRTRNDNREQKGKLCAGPSCLGVYLEDSDYMKEYGYMKSQQHITGFVILVDTMCKIITLPKTGRANIVIKEYFYISLRFTQYASEDTPVLDELRCRWSREKL